MGKKERDIASVEKDIVLKDYIEHTKGVEEKYRNAESADNAKKIKVLGDLSGWLSKQIKPSASSLKRPATEEASIPKKARKVTFDFEDTSSMQSGEEKSKEEIMQQMGEVLYEQMLVLNKAVNSGIVSEEAAQKFSKDIESDTKSFSYIKRVSDTKSLGLLKKRPVTDQGPRSFVDLTKDSDSEKSLG